MLIGQVVDKMPSVHLRRPDSALICSDTFLGVECEVENCRKGLPNTNVKSGYWENKEDGSLRDNGREFVFREPLFGADVVAAIDHLCESANALKWTISERCGLHVHMDMRNMEVEKAMNFVILYALTEKPIYYWVGDNRDSNIHCLPWYAADGDLERISAVFREPKEAIHHIKALNRYAGLNLAALGQFGSAEFRHLKMTFDRNRIIQWINIILSLKLAAIAWEGKPSQLIQEMRVLGAYGFLERIFKQYTSMLWYGEFAKDFIGISIPTAQHILKNVNFSELKKESVFRSIRQSAIDEQGEHPGLTRWKRRRPQQAKMTPRQIAEDDMIAQAGKVAARMSSRKPIPMPVFLNTTTGVEQSSSIWAEPVYAFTSNEINDQPIIDREEDIDP
jgi:hypothetical protein